VTKSLLRPPLYGALSDGIDPALLAESLAPPGKLHSEIAPVTKLRGTEAEIYARLRELTEEFRQLRRELSDGTNRRVTAKDFAAERRVERSRPLSPSKPRKRTS
jgi:hypothetical protein